MLDLKVSRRCEFYADDQLSTALIFVGKNNDLNEYVVLALISDSSFFTASYDQESWIKLREESDFSSDDEFIAELCDPKITISIERSDDVQVKWNRPDEDGLKFEFCTMTLCPNTVGIFSLVDALLTERNNHYENLTRSDVVIADMERKFELLSKYLQKVEEMDEYRRNLSNTLISKFVAIQNKNIC
ncbi:unnamed protein product [Thelazia callipaeda]|uniref:GOLD domain-containing protein n=1 Tax=Thelazia callipaeda TaxID=103827 RepID=A0A0N5D7K0_THECL|nr:unnamed protein product [Thelazia callipaeda]